MAFSQKTSQSSSSGSSIEQHQPSMDQQYQRGSSSSSGSSADQPGPSNLQVRPLSLQDGSSLEFPSQELSEFDFMCRDEGASTHQLSTGRRDAGARSGHLSDDGRIAEVPHTETSSSSDDNAVVPAAVSLSNGQQDQHKIQQRRILHEHSPLSDVSQASLVVPSCNDSTGGSNDHAVPKNKTRKLEPAELSQPMSLNISSSGSSDDAQSHSSRVLALRVPEGRRDTDSPSDSSVDAPSTTSVESGSSSSSSSVKVGELLSRELLTFVSNNGPSTSQSVPMLGFSQSAEESSYHIPATPESLELPSLGSDVVSSTPDADGSSQELIRGSPGQDHLQLAGFKRDRSYDGDVDDDASSLLEETAPKRRKLSTSASTSASLSPKTSENGFKTPSKPVLQRSKSGSSSGGSSGGSLGSVVTRSSSTPYPSSASNGTGQTSSSLSNSDLDTVQVDTTSLPAMQKMAQLDASKEDPKDACSAAESSQSMDATVSLDVGEIMPHLTPGGGDDGFNLYLSNATTDCSISTGTQDGMLDDAKLQSDSQTELQRESQNEPQTNSQIVKSQSAIISSSSSSSSEQATEESLTTNSHATSPSPDDDDDDDNDAARGRRDHSSIEEGENNHGSEGNKEDKQSKDSKNSGVNSGESDKQQGENDCTIVNVCQPLLEDHNSPESGENVHDSEGSKEDQQTMDSKNSESDMNLGESDKQQGKDDCAIVSVCQPLLEDHNSPENGENNHDSERSKEIHQQTMDSKKRDMNLGESDVQPVKDDCTIVKVYQPSVDKAAEIVNKNAEFDLGITTSGIITSNAQQVYSDSPIKLSKVLDDFSQDSFPQLSIRAPDSCNVISPVQPLSFTSPHTKAVKDFTATNAVNNVDPFEFHSDDEACPYVENNIVQSQDDRNNDEVTVDMEVNGDITPSEHGQVAERSSEDPLTTGASRSEVASSVNSSPRMLSDVTLTGCSQEHQTRTTIYTTVTTITKKRFREEELVKDCWITTNEYQEELDPVIEESEEVRHIKSFPPKTVPFQDTSISSSFTTNSSPKSPQITPRRHSATSKQRSSVTSSYRVNEPTDSSLDVTHVKNNSRAGSLPTQPGSLECAEDRVLARWKDGHWYAGTINEHLRNGKYMILFDDGDKRVLSKSAVVPMSFLRLGSEVLIITDDDDYLRGSITGKCTVCSKPGFVINTGGREALECPESDLKLTPMLMKQLTNSGCSSPAASPTVRGRRSLLTTPLSSKKSKTTISPTVNMTGLSPMLFFGLSFLITGEGKSSQSLGNHIMAAGGTVLLEFPNDVCPTKMFLLADKTRRTVKYLLALAGGVPCIRPVWAKDCLKQNRLLDYAEYLLPAGECSKTNKMIPWSPREPRTILSKLRIFLNGDSTFKQFWNPIITTSGAKLVSRLSYSVEAGNDCDLVLCQEGMTGDTLRRAQNLQLPCIEAEWAVQCLIKGEQLDRTGFVCM